jgi:hypothetical protein
MNPFPSLMKYIYLKNKKIAIDTGMENVTATVGLI